MALSQAASANAIRRVFDVFAKHSGERISAHRIAAIGDMSVETVRRALGQLLFDDQIRSARGNGRRAPQYWRSSDALAETFGQEPCAKPVGEKAAPRGFTFRAMEPGYVARHLQPVVRSGAGQGAVPGVTINQSEYDRGW